MISVPITGKNSKPAKTNWRARGKHSFCSPAGHLTSHYKQDLLRSVLIASSSATA